LRLAAETRTAAGCRRVRSGRGSSSRVCRGRSGWVRSGPPFDRPRAGAVYRCPRPVDLAGGAEDVQQQLVQPAEHAGVDPLAEAAVRRRRADSERGGQCCPGAAGLQDVQDRREHGPVVKPAPSTALVTLRRSRQQRRGELPQRFRTPTVNIIHVRSTKPVATGHALTRCGLRRAWQRSGRSGPAGCRDLNAVTAGLTETYISGPVEGNVNRVKTIKRRMYGRAGLDLLRMLVSPVMY
jgi:hypothetical protein